MYILIKGVEMTRRFLITVCCIILVNFLTVVSKTITSAPSGGNWGEPAAWTGNIVPTETDDVIITSTIYCPGQSYSTKTYKCNNLTIENSGKIIRLENSAGMSSILINGNLVNKGELIDYDNYFDLEILGNISNYGTLSPRNIQLTGTNASILTENFIECKTLNINTTNPAKAVSDLLFTDTRISSSSNPRQAIDLNGFDYILNSKNLTYDGYYNTFNTNSHSSVELRSSSSNIILNNSILTGEVKANIEIRSESHAIIGDLEVYGDVTIHQDASVLSRKHLMNFIIRGDYYNYGLLSSDTLIIDNETIAPLSFKISVFGNAHNLSPSGVSDFFIYSQDKNRIMSGNYSNNVTIYNEYQSAPGGTISLSGDCHIGGKLYVYSDLVIPNNSTLHLDNYSSSPIIIGNNGAQMTVDGNIYRYHVLNNSSYYRSFNDPTHSDIAIEVRTWDGEYSANAIETHTSQYVNMEGSIQKWWRVSPIGDLNSYKYVLHLYYDDQDLNGLNEDDLDVFLSTNEGESWDLISFGDYVVHNKEENYFQIGSWTKEESLLTEFGDFTIGSVTEGMPIESPLCLDFIGDKQVRIGAPNRYTIYMYNPTDKIIPSFFVCFNNSERINFSGVEIPHNEGFDYIPIDSIGNPEDALVFVVPYLDPKEEYSFDVILEGLPESGKTSDVTLSASEGLSIMGFVKFAKDDMKDATISDYANKAFELDAKEREEYSRFNGIAQENLKYKKKKEGYGVTTARNVIKYTMEKISDTNPVSKTLFKIGSWFEFVHSFSTTLRHRIMYAIQKDLGAYDKKYFDPNSSSTQGVSGKHQSAELVVSKDPNAIVGPVGYGDFNFVEKLEMAHYKILFENMADATAPAYKIEILDTLDENIYDISTVKFGRTSHEGENYNWQISKNGNILRWYIEGIELKPNKNPPEGEGWVSYSVKLKESVATGDQIKNRASIIFDVNDPILTNTWINVIDDVSPTSEILDLNYKHGTDKLTVSINGADNKSGSGIGRYYVYASVNNTPYRMIMETCSNETEFEFELGRDTLFRIYAIAFDNVNNMQNDISNIEEININSTSVYDSRDLDINVTVGPVPVKDILNITIENGNNRKGVLRISDVLGNVVVEKNIDLNNNVEYYDIPFQNISHGAYIVDIMVDGKAKSIKIVK